jgi:hypothetical protein
MDVLNNKTFFCDIDMNSTSINCFILQLFNSKVFTILLHCCSDIFEMRINTIYQQMFGNSDKNTTRRKLIAYDYGEHIKYLHMPYRDITKFSNCYNIIILL